MFSVQGSGLKHLSGGEDGEEREADLGGGALAVGVVRDQHHLEVQHPDAVVGGVRPDSGCIVQGSGFRVQGSGFRVKVEG